MSTIHHFYLTFNPFLNNNYEKGYSQAHEFYDLLKQDVVKNPGATLHWGKIISKDRDAGVPLENFQKVLAANSEQNLSTHLFITDFQNLWVGKVKTVTGVLPKNGKTLSFYTDKKVEVWFEIEDFFLLEHDTEETAKKIGELYLDNEYSKLKIDGLSPFTTSVKYPCIIQDLAEEQFFDSVEEASAKLILKNNPAVLKSSANMVLKTIHTYLFPEDMYDKIPHAAKLEIETAELDMMESRHHNAHKMAFSYIQALEVVLNDLVINHIKRKGLADDIFVDSTSSPAKLYFNQTKDYYVPLKTFQKNFSINNILNFLDRGTTQNSPSFRQAFSEHKGFINFCVKELDPIIKNNKLIEIRNLLAHGEAESISLKDAIAVRNIILGCGTNGLIYDCYRTFYVEKFRHYCEVTDIKGVSDDKKSKLKLVA